MKRPSHLLVCLSVAANEAVVEGMVTPTFPRTTRSPPAVSTSSFVADGRTRFQKATSTTPRRIPNYWNKVEEDDDDDDLAFEVTSFQELQRSTGSEILDDRLQQQIDTVSDNPNVFLDAHESDASYMEKVAMSSIPEQLPQPAVNALRNRRRANNNISNTSNRKRGNLQVSTAVRVSPDEEIELAKMIQKGVQLHRLKADYEEQHGQKLSRNQWAKLAGLDSASQLRREVANYRRAKQLLVSANVGLVHSVVKKQNRNGSGGPSTPSYEELVQEGSLGLLRAAELFDPSRGLRFSTYATIWIKGSLGNSHMMETIKLPARERTKWNKIVKAHDELAMENGLGDQDPPVEQVAERLGMNVAEVISFQRKMKQAKHVLSLDYEYQQQSRSGDAVADSNSGLENDKAFQADADLAERMEMQADVIAAMARNLTPREARLMRLRYGLTDGHQRSLRECAEAMGLSEARVQQLGKACLKKLREAAEAESLEEYLLTMA